VHNLSPLYHYDFVADFSSETSSSLNVTEMHHLNIMHYLVTI